MKWTIFGNRLSKVSFHQIFSRKYLSVSDLRTLFIHWMILFSFFSISSLFFIWTLFMAYPLVDETDSFHETVMNATKFFIMNTTPSWSENYCAWTLNFCTILAFNLIARCVCVCAWEKSLLMCSQTNIFAVISNEIEVKNVSMIMWIGRRRKQQCNH